MKPYSPYLAILTRIQKDITADLKKHRIHCETGDYLDSAVLKLQKPSWTDGGSEQGIFFSIWLGEKDLKKHRFNYNIHALKLRLRKDHSIKPREFAAAFRGKLKATSQNWPNLRTNYGPQTLMQGWHPLNIETFPHDTLRLIQNFIAIHPIIDTLLAERKPQKHQE